MDEAPEIQEVLLNGKVFESGRPQTLRQDIYCMRMLRKIHPAALVDDGTQPAGNVMLDLVFQAYDEGVLWDMLAGVLVEKNVQWSPESAKRNAEVFANLVNADDKGRLNAVMTGVIMGFFMNALGSSEISPSALMERLNVDLSLVESPPANFSAGTTTTEAGTTSSES